MRHSFKAVVRSLPKFGILNGNSNERLHRFRSDGRRQPAHHRHLSKVYKVYELNR
jgi:hypothetical protein